MGYRPGWGPALALTSARRRRPAAGSTPPRPWCSPAGCWPEARRWRRDLMDKAESRLLGGEGHGQPAGTASQSLGGAWTERPMPTWSSQTWSAQAGLQTARLSALLRLGPAPHLVRFSHQSRSLHPSVCPVSSLPVPGARVGGGRARKQVPWRGCVCTCRHGASPPMWVQNLDRGGCGVREDWARAPSPSAPGDSDLADARPGP